MLTKFRRNEKNRKKIKDFFSIVFFISLGAGVLLITTLLIMGNIRVNEKRNELNTKVDFLEKQIQELQEREELLKSQILEVKEDEYLEEKARNIFERQKEGEKAFIITEKH